MRYLTGRLPASESAAFEQKLSEDPELREQTEEVLKLREGLARLQDRGELEALLPEPARRGWVPYATAAALVIMMLTALLWVTLPRQLPTVLASSPRALTARQALSGSYTLARTRGPASVTEISRGGPIELRVLPSVTARAYRASISRSDGKPAGVAIETGPGAGEGYVLVYLDTQQLLSGDYALSLSPVGTPTSAESDRFPIRIR